MLAGALSGRFAGQVVVVTGSGGSIGRAACLRFAAEGAIVIGCDRHIESAVATLAAVPDGGGKMYSLAPCDLGDANGAQALIDFAIVSAGRIDVLYNNAALAHFAWFAEMDFAMFQQTMRDELDLVFHACKAVWPHFVAQRQGVIINTASVSGMICYEVVPGLAHSTAKAGIIGMTRHLAMEGAAHNIRVNALSPGLVETNQTSALMGDPDWWGAMRAKIMLGRAGQPEDIAAAAAFLASSDAGWITGANLPVDGGTTAW
jgi:NAD(P)-dependent dehydrogenase (short-subunit alcohol dehydrogenase family)